MKNVIILFYSVLFTTSAYAFGVKDTYFGVGNYTAMPGKVQIDERGDTNGLFDFGHLYFGGIEYQIFEDWSAFAEAGFVKPSSGESSGLKNDLFFLILRCLQLYGLGL